MRVLHLAPGPETGSGIAAYAARFREALTREGVEVQMLCAPTGQLNSPRDVSAYCRTVRRDLERGYDVVHTEFGGAALRQFYGCWTALKFGRAAVCATVHDPPHPVWFPFHTDRIRSYRVLASPVRIVGATPAARFERALIARLSTVFALSQAGVESIRAAYPRIAPSAVLELPYPIDPAPLRATPPQDGTVVVGFFGYWYPGKGIDLLVEAVAQARREEPRLRARLYGSITPSAGDRPSRQYREHVLRRIDELGVGDIVDPIGELAEQDVAAALQGCHAMIVPFEHPGRLAAIRSTSASMLEALAAGVPVIASDVRSHAETVRAGENGLLFPAGDVGRLAELLSALCRDDGLRARLREGAQITAQGFSSQHSAERAIAAYHRCVT